MLRLRLGPPWHHGRTAAPVPSTQQPGPLVWRVGAISSPPGWWGRLPSARRTAVQQLGSPRCGGRLHGSDGRALISYHARSPLREDKAVQPRQISREPCECRYQQRGGASDGFLKSRSNRGH